MVEPGDGYAQVIGIGLANKLEAFIGGEGRGIAVGEGGVAACEGGAGYFSQSEHVNFNSVGEISKSEVGAHCDQQGEEADEPHRQEGVEGELLPPRDALVEKTAVVVQVFHAHFTLLAVFHPACPVAPALRTVGAPLLVVLLVADGREVSDAGVHELGQEIRDVGQDEDCYVDEDEFVELLLADGLGACARTRDEQDNHKRE